MTSANRKLTDVLKGKTINGTSQSGSETTISFTDGSKMAIRTAPSNSNSASSGGAVNTVRQSVEPPVLYVDLVGGSTLEVPLAEATSSVTVHDKDGGMQYAD